MNTCEKCRYYMASPLQEPCESCHWDGVIGHDPTNWKRPTNADRIRAMSDEELAVMFFNYHYSFTCPEKGCHECKESCMDCWLDWLKEEVK